MNFIREEKKMKYINSAILLIAVLFLGVFSVAAQETETVVVDEVVAQCQRRRDHAFAYQTRNQRRCRKLGAGRKTAQESVEKLSKQKSRTDCKYHQCEELLIQKAKEMGAESEVEARINQQLRPEDEGINLKTWTSCIKQWNRQTFDLRMFEPVCAIKLSAIWFFEREVDGESTGDFFQRNKDITKKIRRNLPTRNRYDFRYFSELCRTR